MSTFIDSTARQITTSVGDLLGDGESRAIGLTGTGLSRMWIGQELHRRVQAELVDIETDYRPEVFARASFEIDGWNVDISGRADGVLYEGETPIRIDEIKTLHFSVDLYNLYIQERLEKFRRQLRLYAYMLSDEACPAACRLILVDIVTGDERSETVDWSAEAVHTWLRQKIHRLISIQKRRLTRIAQLKSAANDLPFPHPTIRPAQITIGDAISEALNQSRNVLIRAPTGCGKTAAVLHPAVQTAMSSGRKLFFLTAKTLQQKIAVEATKAMQQGLFRSLQLRAKSKMCAHTEVICHEEICPYAAEYGLKLVHSQILENLLEANEHQDPEEIFEKARNTEVCPFEVSLDLMDASDVLVCDYNYVFDPAIGLNALVHGNTLNDAILIIDEAHNLVERSRGYYSPSLNTESLSTAQRFLDTRDNEVFFKLRRIIDNLEDHIREIVANTFGETGVGTSETTLSAVELRDLRIEFDGAMLLYFVYKRENKMWMASDPVLDVFLELTKFHRVLGLGGDEFVQLATRADDGREELKILCLDASRFLAETIEASAGVVAMSATLEPFDFYRNLLGFDEQDTDELFVPSPFPKANRLVISINDIDTTYRKRAMYFDAIGTWIAQLAHPEQNVLVLFPSYVFLRAVHERMPPSKHEILVQQSGASDSDQHLILSNLANGKATLLLAVMGGIYAEGIDYPGKMLSQVFIVSPGLPPFNMERELLKSYYQEHYGHSFAYAYLIPGLTRVVQAAGRLLRSDDDRGVITLIGKRFQDGRYAKYLPTEWTDGDPKTMLYDDPVAMVERFFE